MAWRRWSPASAPTRSGLRKASGRADAANALAHANDGVEAEDHVDPVAVRGQRQAQPKDRQVRRASPGEAVDADPRPLLADPLAKLDAPVIGGRGIVDFGEPLAGDLAPVDAVEARAGQPHAEF